MDDDAATWLVYWPSSLAPLVVHSSVRLPNAFHAPRADAGSAASLVRLPTCEGDVLVALSAPLAESSLGDLARDLASGGPTAVDAVARCKSAEGGLPAGVVVEVWP